jgi:transcriptional regulator with XRE-family HTH domain
MPKMVKFLGYDPISSVPTNLGEKLLQFRKSYGLNQEELARQIGIDPTTLSRVERGRVNSSTTVKEKISKFLMKNLPRNEVL